MAGSAEHTADRLELGTRKLEIASPTLRWSSSPSWWWSSAWRVAFCLEIRSWIEWASCRGECWIIHPLGAGCLRSREWTSCELETALYYRRLCSGGSWTALKVLTPSSLGLRRRWGFPRRSSRSWVLPHLLHLLPELLHPASITQPGISRILASICRGWVWCQNHVPSSSAWYQAHEHTGSPAAVLHRSHLQQFLDLSAWSQDNSELPLLAATAHTTRHPALSRSLYYPLRVWKWI